MDRPVHDPNMILEQIVHLRIRMHELSKQVDHLSQPLMVRISRRLDDVKKLNIHYETAQREAVLKGNTTE